MKIDRGTPQKQTPPSRPARQPGAEAPSRQAAPAAVQRTAPKKAARKGPGTPLMLITLLPAVLFAVVAASSRMVPLRYVAVLCVVLLLLIRLCWWLAADRRRRGRVTAGWTLGVVLAIFLLTGAAMMWRTVAALNNMAAPTHDTVEVALFVLQEDPAQTLEDLAGCTAGYPQTDAASARQLLNTLSVNLAAVEYPAPFQVADALVSGEIRAAVLPREHLYTLEETEGYEELAARLREITAASVQVERDPDAPGPAGNVNSREAFTIYISGSDSRTGLSARARSDVNIIATINPQTKQVLLISTPRDYYVPLSISNGVRDKLTHAGIYGVQVSMDTLAMLYDIQLDYYFRVSFEGFEAIVDSLGGVTVHSDYSFTGKGGYHFVKGDNVLNGAQALSFARERYAFRDGDRQRGRNQMELIRAIIQKAASPELLVRYTAVLNAVEGCFETSVPYTLIADLVRDQLASGGSWNVVSYSVSGADASEKPWSLSTKAYVMLPDDEMVATAKDLMERVRAGETVTAP